MMLGARTAAWAKSGGVPTAKDYVQDGLVAMWDGIENAGWGVHDQNATVWKDLVGDFDFDLSSASPAILSNGITLTEESIHTNLPQVNRPKMTVEVVANPSSIGVGALVWMRNPSWIGGALVYWITGTTYYPWNILRIGELSNTVHSIQMFWEAGNQGVNIDGISDARTSGTIDSRNILSQIYLGEYNGSKITNSTFYSVRLYDRVLTDSELAANYAIDKARFSLT